jgi:hypothetical protein
VVYTLGQVPLVVLSYRALRAPADSGDPVGARKVEPGSG